MVAGDNCRIIYMFPGQGSQQVKMGFDVWQKYTKAKEIFALASEIFGEDLTAICFNKPFREMQRTDRAQILITTVSVIFYELLKEAGILPNLVLGHSAGELAALYASGAIGLEDVLKLSVIRGKSMYEAALQNKGKMVAILGLDIDAVHKLVEESAESAETVVISNYNAPQEIVISGDADAISKIEQHILIKQLARAVDLKQQGAWHTIHMQAAQEKFATEIAKINLKKTEIPIMFNNSVEYAEDAATIRKNLVNILTSTVQWYPCLCKLIENPPQTQIFCEVGPNKILRGLLRKSYHEITYNAYEVFSVNDLESLTTFIQKIKKYSSVVLSQGTAC